MRAFQAEKILKPKDALPFRLAEHFGPETPVDLEIGCGVGWHPIRYALENPKRFLIAVEHTREKFEKFKNRFETHGKPKNLLPVHANAVAWVTHCLPANSISRCLILYPNPNPKNPSQRWIRMPFMSQLIETLRKDGEIVFASNLESYADEIVKHAKDWNLQVAASRKLGEKSGEKIEPRTHFEKKYLARGETCFEISLKRY
jgi:tRNA (guanine-N7-)-methyltransferase